MVESLLDQFGHLLIWMQAVGALIVAWLIFQVIALIYNMKRMKEIYVIKKDMVRIEDKIDRILKKKR